jgi:hypothetical protein
VTGKIVRKIGFLNGSLSDVFVIAGLLQRVSQLVPPDQASDPSNRVHGLFSVTGLIEIVQQNLSGLVSRFVNARNPRQVYDSLVLIPSLAMQALVTARWASNIDLGPLLRELELVTHILVVCKIQKEHFDLFGDEIHQGLNSCQDAWTGMMDLGIDVPKFAGWDDIRHEHKKRIRPNIQNVSIECVPAADIAIGRWMTTAEMGMRWDENLIRNAIAGQTRARQINDGEGFSPDYVSPNPLPEPKVIDVKQNPAPKVSILPSQSHKASSLSPDAMQNAINNAHVDIAPDE